MTQRTASGVIPARALWAPLGAVLGGQAAVSATSFATTLVLGRLAGESALGLFALGWSIWFFALSLGDTLLSTPYTYYVAQKQAIARDLVMCTAWGMLFQAIAFAAALAALCLLDVAGMAALWPALPAAIAACIAREFYRRHLLARGEAALLLRVDFGGSALQLAGLAVLAATQSLSAMKVLWVVAIAAGVAVLPLSSARRWRRLAAARHEALPVLRRYFAFGRWLVLGGLCHAASVQAYPWLAFAAGGERLAGLFAACNSLVNLMAPLLTGLTNHFRPKFIAAQIQLSPKRFERYVARRAGLFVVPPLALTAVMALFGAPLLSAIYGPGFLPAAGALPWMGLGLMGVAIAAPLQLALLALHAPVTNFYYHGGALLVLAPLAMVTYGAASITGLGQIYGAVNIAAMLVLGGLFLATNPARRH